jgi:hypothetical protein
VTSASNAAWGQLRPSLSTTMGPGRGVRTKAYFATAGRPENRPFVQLLLDNGLQQLGGVETDFLPEKDRRDEIAAYVPSARAGVVSATQRRPVTDIVLTAGLPTGTPAWTAIPAWFVFSDETSTSRSPCTAS